MYKTDRGRPVTGGGGIQPDILITPAEHTRLELVLDASGSVTSFATQYLAAHKPLLEPFSVTPDMIDDFKVFLAARSIQPGVAEWATERPWISTRLEVEIVTQARGVDKGEEIEERHDVQVQAAIEALTR
jgi:carboxyl-terminal processing protease